MSEKRFSAPFRSLSAKLLLATLLSLLCAAATYAGVFWIGTAVVNRYYMSAAAVAARKAEIYTDLNRFVSAGDVAGNDADALQRFLAERAYVSITVYSAEELQLPSAEQNPPQADAAGGAGEDHSAEILTEEAQREEQAPAQQNGGASPGMQSYTLLRRSESSGKLYPLRFSDGLYYVSITDTSRTREDMLNRGMAAAVAVLVLVSLLFWYTSRLSRRIIRLSQETASVGAGDLEAEITVDGIDEVAALAADIDGMRDAIIQRMGNEKRAWEANSELITAMSHDIRTPMTSLIGYLGLLNSAGTLSDEERKRYLKAAYGKSLALKELTDELFKYFLVFGRSELELNSEDYDAHMLLMQLLGEAQFDLEDAGFHVQNLDRLGDGILLKTDAAMLKRVLDNLVSNIKKYADRGMPVVFLTEWKNRVVNVTVSNAIAPRSPGAESTRIGLRTCEKILSALGGTFTTVRDEDHFAAEFSLPAASARVSP